MIEKVQAMAARFLELEAILSREEVLADPSLMRKYLKEHGALRRVSELYERRCQAERGIREAQELLSSEKDSELLSMARDELDQQGQRIEAVDNELRELLTTTDADDACDAILMIQAGTGGAEAGLFVGDLLRMYSRLADRRGWKFELLSQTSSSAGGFKAVTVSVGGDHVFRELRFESGGHRVQRVPETESQGRIHTSLAAVIVLPEVDEIDVQIPDDELEVQTFCASGPGGQHVNKTESAVRIIHIPTGIKVECQDEKSQHMNRIKARRILVARVADHLQAIRDKEIGDKRRALRGSGDRSERVRTYNFPQNRLTDHRIGLTLYSLDRVMDGDLEEVLQALRNKDREERLTSPP